MENLLREMKAELIGEEMDLLTLDNTLQDEYNYLFSIFEFDLLRDIIDTTENKGSFTDERTGLTVWFDVISEIDEEDDDFNELNIKVKITDASII